MDSRPALTESAESLWQLEADGRDGYLGWGRDGAPGRLFGGQVAAQAIAAAGADLPSGWRPASLHAYFARAGRSDSAVRYGVEEFVREPDRIVRRVTATQSDQTQAQRAIFVMDAALCPLEEPLPPRSDAFDEDDPPPGGWLPEGEADRAWMRRQAEKLRFELRFSDRPSRVAGRSGEVVQGQTFWLRALGSLSDDAFAHACALTFASDLMLVSTALAVHGLPGRRRDVQAASIDHAVWFHRPARLDEWVRYEQASPTSAGARGFTTGRILDRAGELVASVRQEALMRLPSTVE